MKSESTIFKGKAFIVVGLGYGDEGKGFATDYLCSNANNPLVIRYNGGHQAGHTVVTKNHEKHVFSNFGSGTLRKAPTFWSQYCTFSPTYFLEEYKTLFVKPTVYLDKFCPVTTHYDVLYNRVIESFRGDSRYGSCGVGFGATIERHKKEPLKLFVNELLNIKVVKEKLLKIKLYYKKKINNETNFSFDQFNHDEEDIKFSNNIKIIHQLMAEKIINLTPENEIFLGNHSWNTYIFEGAQGVLLDKNFGNQPYITKSNTTSKNALEILERNFTSQSIETEIYYVTRAYLTRHGAGPFSEHAPAIKLRNVESETNIYNFYQGDFKVGYLNIDLLNYSLQCDQKFSNGIKKNLIVTCLDHLTTDKLPVYHNGRVKYIDKNDLPILLNCKFNNCKYSYSSCSEDLK